MPHIRKSVCIALLLLSTTSYMAAMGHRLNQFARAAVSGLAGGLTGACIPNATIQLGTSYDQTVGNPGILSHTSKFLLHSGATYFAIRRRPASFLGGHIVTQTLSNMLSLEHSSEGMQTSQSPDYDTYKAVNRNTKIATLGTLCAVPGYLIPSIIRTL